MSSTLAPVCRQPMTENDRIWGWSRREGVAVVAPTVDCRKDVGAVSLRKTRHLDASQIPHNNRPVTRHRDRETRAVAVDLCVGRPKVTTTRLRTNLTGKCSWCNLRRISPAQTHFCLKTCTHINRAKCVARDLKEEPPVKDINELNRTSGYNGEDCTKRTLGLLAAACTLRGHDPYTPMAVESCPLKTLYRRYPISAPAVTAA